MNTHWLYLGLAIVAEIAATATLKHVAGFTRPWPTLGVLVAYGCSFYLLSLSLRGIPLGVAYAIWSGVGLPVIALMGWLVYRQALDGAAALGMALILAGVLVMCLGSGSLANH